MSEEDENELQQPQMMVGYVYRMVCNITGKQYFGSTVQKLSNRLRSHERCYERFLEGSKQKYGAFEILENGDYFIENLGEYLVPNFETLRRYEDEWIRNNVCVNIKRARLTNEDKHENSKIIQRRFKQSNPGKRKEYLKKFNVPVKCVCGNVVNRVGLRAHRGTKKHKLFMEKNPESEESFEFTD